MKWLVLLALVACKQRGTLSIDLSYYETCVEMSGVTPTGVKAFLVRNAVCGAACTAVTCTAADCQVACGGATCPLDEPIVFDPPSAGQYAVTFEFLDQTTSPAGVTATICAQVVVEPDGTMSDDVPVKTQMCCM